MSKKNQLLLIILLLISVFIINIRAMAYSEINWNNINRNYNVKVFIDNKDNELKFTEQTGKPFIANNRTFVPYRVMCEALNAQVDWDNGTRKATATGNGNKVELFIGNFKYKVNSINKIMDVEPFILSDESRTYIPARYVTEGLNYSIDFAQDGKLMYIVSFTKGQTETERKAVLNELVNSKPVNYEQVKLEVEPKIKVVTGTSETFYLYMGLGNDREVVEQSNKYGYKFKIECTNHPEFNVRKYRVPAYGPVRYDTVRTDGWQPTVDWFLTRHDYAYTPQAKAGQVVEYRIQMKDNSDQIVRVWEGKATLTKERKGAPEPVLVNK